MKKAIITLIILIIIVAGVSLILAKKQTNAPVTETPTTETAQDIKGCYIARLAKDVYTLNIQNQTNEAVTGTLAFKNFEKDSSSGTFSGMYQNDVLLGVYSFSSEGMDSVMQVAFKKTPEGFVRGFGDVTTEGNTVKFNDVNALEWDTKAVFKAEACQ
ncbi:MAG TPA: hypothetical protein VGE63_01555 [Candidatus Paceibacterota bacterium]